MESDARVPQSDELLRYRVGVVRFRPCGEDVVIHRGHHLQPHEFRPIDESSIGIDIRQRLDEPRHDDRDVSTTLLDGGVAVIA